MDIDKETVRDLANGHTVVGTSRVQLTALDFKAYKGVLIRCPGTADPGSGNTDPIWVGGSGVTADSSASGGMPVLPNNAMFIPIEQPNLLWVISTAPSQDVAWMVI